MKKIAVLMGGTSNERSISLKSGAAVVKALKESGCDVTPVVLEQDNIDLLPDGIDSVFIALHGGYGENGGVQHDLDLRRIPYTGPGCAASRLAMDKIATKKVLEHAMIPTAPWELLELGDSLRTLELPVVVKPPREGSSVGISKVTECCDLKQALEIACAADCEGQALVESFIPGREWTVSILGGEALSVVEIIAPGGWYGFTEKYTKGVTSFAFPDLCSEADLITKAQCYALLAYQALGCRGVSRVDFRVTDGGELMVLEVNTVPGMTATSLLPLAAERDGIDFCNLCLKLIELAGFD